MRFGQQTWKRTASKKSKKKLDTWQNAGLWNAEHSNRRCSFYCRLWKKSQQINNPYCESTDLEIHGFTDQQQMMNCTHSSEAQVVCFSLMSFLNVDPMGHKNDAMPESTCKISTDTDNLSISRSIGTLPPHERCHEQVFQPGALSSIMNIGSRSTIFKSSRSSGLWSSSQAAWSTALVELRYAHISKKESNGRGISQHDIGFFSWCSRFLRVLDPADWDIGGSFSRRLPRSTKWPP